MKYDATAQDAFWADEFGDAYIARGLLIFRLFQLKT